MQTCRRKIAVHGTPITPARKLRELALAVAPVRGTGEVAVTGPDGIRLAVNGRRKDCPRKLVSLLRRAEASRP